MIKMGVMFVLGFLVCLVLAAMGRTASGTDGVFRFDTEAEEPIVLRLETDIGSILRKRFITLRVETNVQLKNNSARMIEEKKD